MTKCMHQNIRVQPNSHQDPNIYFSGPKMGMKMFRRMPQLRKWFTIVQRGRKGPKYNNSKLFGFDMLNKISIFICNRPFFRIRRELHDGIAMRLHLKLRLHRACKRISTVVQKTIFENGSLNKAAIESSIKQLLVPQQLLVQQLFVTNRFIFVVW